MTALWGERDMSRRAKAVAYHRSPKVKRAFSCFLDFCFFKFSCDLCISWLIPRFRLPAFPFSALL